MYDVEGQRDLAVAEYQAALAVAGAPESARIAAQRGVETAIRRRRVKISPTASREFFPCASGSNQGGAMREMRGLAAVSSSLGALISSPRIIFTEEIQI